VSGGDAEATCVATARTLPRLPLRVAITLPATGEVRAGTITARLPRPCPALANADVDGAFYAVRLDGAPVAEAWFGVADFGGRPRARFRQCTSMEGVHLTAWSGPPPHARRLWHAYVHLGYDVDPDCSVREMPDAPPR
jgi:hypothetical protein